MSLLGSLDFWLIGVVFIGITLALCLDLICELRHYKRKRFLILYSAVAVIMFFAWRWFLMSVWGN